MDRPIRPSLALVGGPGILLVNTMGYRPTLTGMIAPPVHVPRKELVGKPMLPGCGHPLPNLSNAQFGMFISKNPISIDLPSRSNHSLKMRRAGNIRRVRNRQVLVAQDLVTLRRLLRVRHLGTNVRDRWKAENGTHPRATRIRHQQVMLERCHSLHPKPYQRVKESSIATL